MKLYALCDADTLASKKISLHDFVAQAAKLNAEVIQYRNKTSALIDVKHALLELRKIWDGYLIINDHISLAPFCDGVHIGQEDLATYGTSPKKAIETIRKRIGKDKIIGLSTHNKAEVFVANKLDINYIGLGAYRATATKEVQTILGDTLDGIAKHSRFPVAAIGGVRLDDVFEHVTYWVVGSGLYDH